MTDLTPNVAHALRDIKLLVDSPAWAQFQRRKDAALDQLSHDITPLVAQPIAEYEQVCAAAHAALAPDDPEAEAAHRALAHRAFAMLLVSCRIQVDASLMQYEAALHSASEDMVAAMPSHGEVTP
jgi:hypothetical protein